jgi:hypothetical protein
MDERRICGRRSRVVLSDAGVKSVDDAWHRADDGGKKARSPASAE